MPISLDPAQLPELNILTLAQSGAIVRAERETPEDGIPAFITRSGWNELISHHAQEQETVADTATRVLTALEKSIGLLMTQAAKAAQEHEQSTPPSLYSLETDLFPSSPQTRLVFVKDTSHHVACALIGTPDQISDIIRPSSP